MGLLQMYQATACPSQVSMITELGPQFAAKRKRDPFFFAVNDGYRSGEAVGTPGHLGNVG
jgi:hypothetical protein